MARQLTATPGSKTQAQFSPDSREVYYLEAGRVQAMNIESRQVRAVAVTAEMDVNFDREKMAVFEQAWAGQRDGFYDPKMHGGGLERRAQDLRSIDRSVAHARRDAPPAAPHGGRAERVALRRLGSQPRRAADAAWSAS